MEKVLKRNPFLKQVADEKRLYVTFLEEIPSKENLQKTLSYNFPPDEFIIDQREIFLQVPVSCVNSKLNNNFFESKLKVTATTRNWNTVNALVNI